MKATLLIKIHEYGNATERLAKEIANEIKQECSTHGEVADFIDKMKKELIFNDYGNMKYGRIVKSVEEIIEKEKNEMPSTYRSLIVGEEIKPFACEDLSEEEIEKIAKAVTKIIIKDLEQKTQSIVEF